MNDAGVIDDDGLRFERVLPGPIERVWAFLTEPDKRAAWLAAGRLEPEVGGTVELVFHNSRLGPADAPIPERYAPYEGMRFEGRVTRFEAPHVLAHSWDDTEVTFELTPLDDGRVRLVLRQTRIADDEERIGTLAGWHTHLEVLAHRLAGTEPEVFWTRHADLERRYG